MTGIPGEVYVIIALTRLDSGSGMFSILKSETDSSKRLQELAGYDLSLNVGDALVWRAECISRLGSGEGGFYGLVTYR